MLIQYIQCGQHQLNQGMVQYAALVVQEEGDSILIKNPFNQAGVHRGVGADNCYIAKAHLFLLHQGQNPHGQVLHFILRTGEGRNGNGRGFSAINTVRISIKLFFQMHQFGGEVLAGVLHGNYMFFQTGAPGRIMQAVVIIAGERKDLPVPALAPQFQGKADSHSRHDFHELFQQL